MIGLGMMFLLMACKEALGLGLVVSLAFHAPSNRLQILPLAADSVVAAVYFLYRSVKSREYWREQLECQLSDSKPELPQGKIATGFRLWGLFEVLESIGTNMSAYIHLRHPIVIVMPVVCCSFRGDGFNRHRVDAKRCRLFCGNARVIRIVSHGR